MNRTDDTLRTLDAAPAAVTSAERERAGALLERIVAEPPTARPGGAAGSVRAGRTRPPRRPRRRLLLAPLAVAVLAVPLVLAPGPSPALDRAAYASWTSTPTAVGDRSLDAAVSACTDEAAREESADDTGPSFDPEEARQVLAERRGEFVAVILQAPSTDVAVRCLVHDPSDAGAPQPVDVRTVDDVVRGPLAPGTFRLGGFSDGTGTATAPTSRWRSYVDRIAGFVLSGGGQEPPQFRGSIIDGFVGEGVTDVTVHAGAYTVEATVEGGRLVAWWPGPAADCYPQDTGVLRCDEIMTYDLHLADGTTITDAPWGMPAR